LNQRLEGKVLASFWKLQVVEARRVAPGHVIDRRPPATE
jgi:hypothetical protein